MGTDLHRLLTSRPLEKQFIQYFLYQILVSLEHESINNLRMDAVHENGIRTSANLDMYECSED